MATRIFAVLNQKGGVGKTTTCVNLGAGLARAGRKVVLIDMDPQANLTVHLGFDPHEQPAGTTYSVLLGDATLAGSILETNTPGLRLVPSTLGLANAQIFAIHEDLEGNVWFGAIAGGLSRYEGHRLVVYTTADGLADNLVYSVLEDSRGRLWCGDPFGL